ncbi:hypothetical protein [Frankia sp. Cr1]|uniref:hypothetical protein n=1 Tax=Frankia sp. Cr1 TaxID=3073931 RepID=UPI002AD5199A|nr:hypothetical protein [Frankia sp. Cr1]
MFRARLGLTIAALAIVDSPGPARTVMDRIGDETLAVGDGYAARDILTSPISAALAPSFRDGLSRLVSSSGLGRGALPPELLDSFNNAVRAALALINSHLPTPPDTTCSRGRNTRSGCRHPPGPTPSVDPGVRRIPPVRPTRSAENPKQAASPDPLKTALGGR